MLNDVASPSFQLNEKQYSEALGSVPNYFEKIINFKTETSFPSTILHLFCRVHSDLASTNLESYVLQDWTKLKINVATGEKKGGKKYQRLSITYKLFWQ